MEGIPTVQAVTSCIIYKWNTETCDEHDNDSYHRQFTQSCLYLLLGSIFSLDCHSSNPTYKYGEKTKEKGKGVSYKLSSNV